MLWDFPIFINIFWLENILKIIYVSSKHLLFNDLKDDIQEKITFFAFTPFKIHFKTKFVLNICQLKNFNVLTLLFMSNIVESAPCKYPLHAGHRVSQNLS